MDKFIHVRSAKFPILPGEEKELVNEGMYGKSLAEYLQKKLTERGYTAPFVCCEDWGWWVELKGAPFAFGACVYCGPKKGDLLDLFCTDGAVSPKKWSWKKLGFIDTTPWKTKLHEDLVAIFKADPEVQIVSTEADAPFSDDEEES
jgi:hypothetical protein